MDRLPELLMSFTALLVACTSLVVNVWQQMRIDRNERWARETARMVRDLRENGKSTAPSAE